MMDRKWLDYRTTPEEVAEMDGVLSRDAYRRFKQVNRRDMAVVLARIYHFGMMDGAEQARQKAEETEEVNWDDIMEEIRKVKGIGKELAGRINAAVTGRFDNENDAESEGL